MLVSGTLLATLIFMKRALVTAVFLGAVAALGGCPIYSHEDDGCYRNSDCAPGYSCDDRTGACYAPGGPDSCVRPSDCGVNQTCNRSGVCVSGDCSFHGCVAGYTCDSSSGIWECVSSSSGAAGAGNGSAGAAGSAGAEASGPGASGAGGDAALSLSGGSAGQAGG